jgi:hypothetical protein
MTEKPPSDPAAHAQDFGLRYADWADYIVSQPMLDLGIPPERIGTPDLLFGIRHAAFHPQYRNAGGVSPDGRITIESGIFNPALMDPLGEPAATAWRVTRLSVRLNAVIAHEYEEGNSGSHAHAVENAPETDLPIGAPARALLRAIRFAEGRQR